MTRWAIPGATAAALLFLLARAGAQAPTVPTAPAVPAAPGGVAAPAAMPAGGGNIWSKLCMTPEQKEACRQHLCNFPLTPLLGGMLAPARAYSGGVLKPLCPGPNDPNPADKNKPADSAQGAADRIKRKEAEAKARRAAVRYLGTVDCRRYPEAEAALINSLRADENECVRFEAALALANGCCCTKKIIEALTLTVSGKKTNDPAETSPRVKAAAARALERCLACFTEEPPAPPERPPERKEDTPPELPPERPDKPATLPPPLQEEGPVLRPAADRTLDDARRALQSRSRPPAAAAPTSEPPLLPVAAAEKPVRVVTSRTPEAVASVTAPANRGLPPTGQRDLWSLFRNAMRGR